MPTDDRGVPVENGRPRAHGHGDFAKLSIADATQVGLTRYARWMRTVEQGDADELAFTLWLIEKKAQEAEERQRLLMTEVAELRQRLAT